MTDTTFDCNVNRTATGADTTTQMFLINHFLDQVVLGLPAPDVAHANTTNAVSGVGSLGQQVSNCQATQGRVPNFMLVDVSPCTLSSHCGLADISRSSTSMEEALCSKLRPLSMA